MKRSVLIPLISILFSGCSSNENTSSNVSLLEFHVIDTDFSKGRLTFEQTILLDDLVKFHGHLCDGLVVGALAMDVVLSEMYPDLPIDRTNLRIVSKPSPCLTDVAIYLTGGRYQFNTFFVSIDFDGIYVVQRIDDGTTFSVSLNSGVKPSEIDSLGSLAVNKQLDGCQLDTLRMLEDDFTAYLLQTDPKTIFTVKRMDDFVWDPKLRNDYLKTDIINKVVTGCGE